MFIGARSAMDRECACCDFAYSTSAMLRGLAELPDIFVASKPFKLGTSPFSSKDGMTLYPAPVYVAAAEVKAPPMPTVEYCSPISFLIKALCISYNSAWISLTFALFSGVLSQGVKLCLPMQADPANFLVILMGLLIVSRCSCNESWLDIYVRIPLRTFRLVESNDNITWLLPLM